MLVSTRPAPAGRTLAPLIALAGVAALTLAAPAAGAQHVAARPAQPRPDSAARAHEVRRGETLWALADHYFGNSFRWPVIREANADRVSDPHWIYPGQTLRIPAAAPAAETTVADPAVAAPAAPEAPAATTETLAVATVPAAPSRPAIVAPSAARADSAPARPYEALAAPYVGPRNALRGAGVIVDGADIPSAGSRGVARRLQLLDRIVLSLPAGARTERGATYLVATSGPKVGEGEVVVPRGVAILDGGGNEALRTARLVKLFGVVEAGLPVIPLAADAVPVGETTPRVTHVVWIPGAAELPTLQAYVLLGRGARDGVRVGDRFELVADGRRTPDGVPLPVVRAGLVRVVRVTDDASTAVVVHHDQPAIAPGVEARPLPR